VLAPTRDDLRAEAKGGVSLWYIATRAGVSDKSENWILNYVRLLVVNEQFPKPLPCFGLNEKRRAEIGRHSRWSRCAVDAWFDGFIPPHLVTVANDRNVGRDALVLDSRAAELSSATGSGR
jgi:hypothetical protein